MVQISTRWIFPFTFLLLILNSFLTLSGLIYLIFPSYNYFWKINGILIIITLLLNFLIFHFIKGKINKQNKLGKRVNVLIYLYYILVIPSLLLMNLGNLLKSVTYSNLLKQNISAFLLIGIGFFGILLLGWIILFLSLMGFRSGELWKKEELILGNQSEKKNEIITIVKGILTILCLLDLVFSFLILLIIVIGGNFKLVGIPVASSQFGIFWTFSILSCTFILIQIFPKKESYLVFYFILFIGLLMSLITFLPQLSTQYTVNQISKNFDQTFNPLFGGDWQSTISPDVEQYFLETPYYFTQYFLGVPPKDCAIIKDILFFNGSESSYEVDKEILLYFDVYMPLNGGIGLPGHNSTLIRFHPGCFEFGDKGIGSNIQMNKYFASQGYIVFDVQYGLRKGNTNFITPEYTQGDFSIADIVRHIGNFTHYFVSHANEFGAKLDSVFFSGASAGGQLVCATAWGISSGLYTQTFNPNLTVKGLVPFYPSNGIFGASDSFSDPTLMIESNSPPCLIYHGKQDGNVPLEISENILNRYMSKGNPKCCILSMPFAGHSSEFYFPGNYNQIFLYFMERFMFLFH